MKAICVQHCQQLQLRSTSEQKGVCLATPINCLKYRQQPTEVDDYCHACEEFLQALFDINNIANHVNLIDLIQAVHTDDRERINAYMDEILPVVDWIQLDDIGIGSDWSGVKIAIVCSIAHPQLRAVVGLVVGNDSAKLTLGRVEHLDTTLISKTIKQPKSNEYLSPINQRQSYSHSFANLSIHSIG